LKFSVNWITEMTGGLNVTPVELARLITQKTAEQEGVETVGAHLAMVCAARVEQVEPIEGSHNRKATVETKLYGRRTVVCGAPNCRPGIVTAYVPPGCVLNGREIGKTVIAGVESDGMLASGAELGLNRDGDGILEMSAEPGMAIPGCAPDSVIEIDNKSLTHRPDLWGHHGMAREVAAIIGKPLRDPVELERLPSGPAPVGVSIEDYDLCPRYSALVFDNVTVGPSPLWLQYRLETVGLNPINNIVDVTNYVMAEIAQPMHAFDAGRLAGDTIYVRRARTGEKIVALDDEEYTLDEQALVIADSSGAVAIAGVIGGSATGVTDKTRRIVLESANFHPGSIRKTSGRLKLRTDASMRFEKGQDPHNTVRGLARALVLLEQVSPGIKVAGGVADAARQLSLPPEIELPLEWLRRKLGRVVPREQVRAILESLEFEVREIRAGVFSVRPPSWRATKDVSIKDDLVEEVGRMVGYDTIVPEPPLTPSAPPPANPERDYLQKVRQICAGQGFTEVYNYSFVNPPQVEELGLPMEDHVKVMNPISSDLGLLRTSLLPGILRNIRDNSRHLESFRLFELGHEIHRRKAELPSEVSHLAAVVYAKTGNGESGLLEAKRLAECLLRGAKVKQCQARSYEHPVRAYEVHWRGETVGRLAEVHPNLVTGRAAVLDLNLTKVQQMGEPPVQYRPLQRYPSSAFDLSVVTGIRETVAWIEEQLASHAGEFLQGIEFLRQYAGPPLAEGQKSLSFRLRVASPERTLSAEEIGAVRTRVISGMEKAGYELRV
jgi:phenylalanyl-tRNA synthetase beta chain